MSTFADFESAVETLLATTPEQQRAHLGARYSADASDIRCPLPLRWSLPCHDSPPGEPDADSPAAARRPVDGISAS
jgi:hypothetical protein